MSSRIKIESGATTVCPCNQLIKTNEILKHDAIYEAQLKDADPAKINGPVLIQENVKRGKITLQRNNT